MLAHQLEYHSKASRDAHRNRQLRLAIQDRVLSKTTKTPTPKCSKRAKLDAHVDDADIADTTDYVRNERGIIADKTNRSHLSNASHFVGLNRSFEVKLVDLPHRPHRRSGLTPLSFEPSTQLSSTIYVQPSAVNNEVLKRLPRVIALPDEAPSSDSVAPETQDDDGWECIDDERMRRVPEVMPVESARPTHKPSYASVIRM